MDEVFYKRTQRDDVMRRAMMVMCGLLFSQLVAAGQITMIDPQRFAPTRTASMFLPTSLKGSAPMQRLSILRIQSRGCIKSKELFKITLRQMCLAPASNGLIVNSSDNGTAQGFTQRE